MAVKILCLASDGEAGRKRGAIIHIQEGKTLDDIQFGKKCCPPSFFCIGIPDKNSADLPNDMLAYGGHKSRILVEIDKLPSATIDALENEDVVELAMTTVTAVNKDQGTEWNALEEV